MGNNIFVGAMADVFGEWVPDEWIEEIFNVCLEHAEHNYLFLTKNPERYMKLANAGKLPQQDNFWYGTTVTRPDQEYAWFESGTYNWFLSIEPILEDFGKFGATVKTAPPWIIVGAQTGRSKNKVIPEFEWIKNLVAYCRYVWNTNFYERQSDSDCWRKEYAEGFSEAAP